MSTVARDKEHSTMNINHDPNAEDRATVRLVKTEHGLQLVGGRPTRQASKQPKSGRGRGVCSCGWHGAWRVNPNDAYAAADAHLDRMVKRDRYGWHRHDIDVEEA